MDFSLIKIKLITEMLMKKRHFQFPIQEDFCLCFEFGFQLNLIDLF